MPLTHFRNALRQSLVTLIVSSSLIACSDTTIGTRSFEETQSFPVPGGFLIGTPLSFQNFKVPINLADQEAYRESDLDFVTSVNVRDVVFEVAPESVDAAVDPLEDGNLDSFEFVSSMSLSLRAVVNGVETIVPIADLPANDPQIASNTTTLTMNVSGDQDIRDLIEAPDGAELLINIAGTIPPDIVQVDAKIRFRVGIGIR